ncbi:MAG: HD family hydrolase [Candidatus Thorarchaeota archaeon]|nr:HD family hydrolase [Candidatus Thorarchaeota archaeon]
MSHDDIYEILSLGEIIKNIPRTGWILAGIVSSTPETVAAHSWGTAYIALIIANETITSHEQINIERVLGMAIIHDLPEAVTSDLPHKENNEAWKDLHDAKAKLEDKIIHEIFTHPSRETVVLDLWDEFCKCETIEARIVRSADILDMLLHARTIEEQGVDPTRLEEFFRSGIKRLRALRIEAAITLAQRLMESHSERVNKYDS